MKSTIKEPQVMECMEIEAAVRALQDLSRAGYSFRGNRFEHVTDGVAVASPEGFLEVVERSPGLVLADFFSKEYDDSVESPENLDTIQKWRAGLGDLAALEHVSRKRALVGDEIGERMFDELTELASFGIRAVLRMSYAGYVLNPTAVEFKTPGEMPVFSVPKELGHSFEFAPHLVCDGLIEELREKSDHCGDLDEDVIDRIDCLAGLRSDISLLSLELAKIALPGVNSWNGF